VLGRLLQSALRAVRKRRQDASAEQDCGKLLEGVITDLESLNSRTEQDFLEIGGKLMGFVAAARQLSSDMSALEMIFGRHSSHTSQVLTRVLERSKQIEARAEAGDQALAGVYDSARHIGRTFRGFQDTVSVFRVLGSLTRIETARLGNAGEEFGNLAEEVNTLTQSIESSGQRILDASSVLQQNMQSALTKVTGLRDSELKELPSLIAEVITSNASLEDRHARAVEAFLVQAAEYEKVSEAIGDLTTAIQFHDITRQQIEHAVTALKRLRAEFPASGRNRFAVPPDTGAVLTLESSQLSNAEQMLASSVGRIERDLDGISGRVRNMAETSKTLMGYSADEQDSFFLQMETRFTAILKVLGTCTQAETETQATLAELEQTLGRMRDAVAEIRQIEIRIRRIAINATIRAVQIGNAGTALNVLAEVMQRLALDCSGITDKVEGSLVTIGDAANRLSGGSGSIQADEHSETDDVLSEMRSAMLELHSSSETGFTRLHQITALSSMLSDEIQAVRSSFSAGKLFTETILGARCILEGIGAQAGLKAGDGIVVGERRLEDFTTHYTMQAERDVHESVATGGESVWVPPADPPTAVPDQEDLGENVELF